MTTLSKELSKQALELKTVEEATSWLLEVDREAGGLEWRNLGNEEDNVHTVEVATDPAGAIVERVTNAIDAVLDLESLRSGDSPASPKKAAQQFFGLPDAGISEMEMSERQALADLIRVVNLESGRSEFPTIEIRDAGTGQHPDDFGDTLVSLHRGNKKTKKHQMGVYNAGSAATYAFSEFTLLISRRCPDLLDGRTDEVGLTVVRYNSLDPERFKTGTYEYCVDADGDCLRIDLPHGELPGTSYGTYVRHIEYELPKYAQPAHGPKKSLHHLFNAALPDPALPFWVEERRVDRFRKSIRGEVERRGIYGLIARLKGAGTADYHDERGPLSLGEENGTITLRYFVLNEGQEPDAFMTFKQGLSLVLNGQRQGVKDRAWVKRRTQLNYIAPRLAIFVDCTDLTNAAKRKLFASTREASRESKLTDKILERVIQELLDDAELSALDEQARERIRANATQRTSKKVRRKLASRIDAAIQGTSSGKKGGRGTTRKRERRPYPPKPRDTDDSALPEVPDSLRILNEGSITVKPGRTAPILIGLNAKNGFLPDHADALNVVIGPKLNDTVRLRSKGRLTGGVARLTLEADGDALVASADLTVTLVQPTLGLVLTDTAILEVVEPPQERKSKDLGGAADIEINWITRSKWSACDPPWGENTAGACELTRDMVAGRPNVIVRAEFNLNEAFRPYEDVYARKKGGETVLRSFTDAYTYPMCWGLFEQAVAEWDKENQADQEGQSIEVDDDYVRGERERMAIAILMAMEPDLAAVEEADG